MCTTGCYNMGLFIAMETSTWAQIPGGRGDMSPHFLGWGTVLFSVPHFMYKITTIFHIACSIHHITSVETISAYPELDAKALAVELGMFTTMPAVV